MKIRASLFLGAFLLAALAEYGSASEDVKKELPKCPKSCMPNEQCENPSTIIANTDCDDGLVCCSPPDDESDTAEEVEVDAIKPVTCPHSCVHKNNCPSQVSQLPFVCKEPNHVCCRVSLRLCPTSSHSCIPAKECRSSSSLYSCPVGRVCCKLQLCPKLGHSCIPDKECQLPSTKDSSYYCSNGQVCCQHRKWLPCPKWPFACIANNECKSPSIIYPSYYCPNGRVCCRKGKLLKCPYSCVLKRKCRSSVIPNTNCQRPFVCCKPKKKCRQNCVPSRQCPRSWRNHSYHCVKPGHVCCKSRILPIEIKEVKKA